MNQVITPESLANTRWRKMNLYNPDELHKPVMVKEVLEYLHPKSGEIIVDATCGLGGHTKTIWEKVSPHGLVIGLDIDEEMLRLTRENLVGDGIILLKADFSCFRETLKKLAIEKVDGVLFDLGISSYHLERSRRGFSFKQDEILDMRFNDKTHKPASFYLHNLSYRELANVFFHLGEEPYSRKIAHAIVNVRTKTPLERTGDLNRVIEQCTLPSRSLKVKTRIYQALRILVNQELIKIVKGLQDALQVLSIGGRVLVISYHSLEDRIVKQVGRFKGIERVTKKPIIPSFEEIKINPRCRSAKLRVLKKLGEINEEDFDRLSRPLCEPFSSGFRE